MIMGLQAVVQELREVRANADRNADRIIACLNETCSDITTTADQ